jgi:hypothetical protein
MHTIQLSDDEFGMLLLALDYATAAAFKSNDLTSVENFIAVMKAVNRNNNTILNQKGESIAGTK